MGTHRMMNLAGAGLALVLASCSVLPGAENTVNTPPDEKTLSFYYPTHIGDSLTLRGLSLEELRHLNLVATNFVSVMVQIPELQPVTVTLQVAEPQTPFGTVLLRVMEDAGLGLQLVSADQGAHYLAYGQLFGETDTGPVLDFEVSVNKIRLSREFTTKPSGIFPASLMSVEGTRFVSQLEIADDIFKEQGGDRPDSFVSGTRSPDASTADVREVRVHDYDRIPADKQTQRELVIANAREKYFESDADAGAPDLSGYDHYRRAVLFFEQTDSLFLGNANKRSVRLMVREFDAGDIIVIKACNDVDGQNEIAQDRAIRVEEEFVGYGVPEDSIHLAPCVRTNYRHPVDNSPVPVEIVQYRTKIT